MNNGGNDRKWLALGLIAIPIYVVGTGLADGASTSALIVMGIASVIPGLIVLLLVVLSKFSGNRPNLSGITFNDGETFERQFMASRAFGMVTVGGLLTATSERMVFVPHRWNIGSDRQKETLSVRWSDVKSANFEAYPLALLTSAALHGIGSSSEKLIVEHSNGTDKFVVIPGPDLVSCLQGHCPTPGAAVAGT